MKTSKKICAALLSLSLVLSFVGCEKALPVYDYDGDALNFDVTLDEETSLPVEKLYSFIYVGDSVMVDTVWITLNTQGFVTDNNRSFHLQQVSAGDSVRNAVADVHYQAFDSEAMRKYYYVPAGKNTVKVPVVVYRDASLADGDVHLNIEVKPDDNFTQGIPAYRMFPLVISNVLTRPSNWSDYYFNTYGPVKHSFMIKQTGLRWDEDFIQTVLDGDYGYIQYLTMFLYQRLQTVNAERQAQGLDVLKESNGKAVKFEYGGSF